MTPLKNVSGNVWAIVLGIGAILAAVTSMITIWDEIDENIQASIRAATVLITNEIQVQTSLITEFIEDDLYERIIMLETEIEILIAANKPVPVQKIIQLKSMKERLESFKNGHD